MERTLDSTWDRKKPISFKLFSHDVLAVLEYGAATMEVKERAKFLCTPNYAYGPLGVPGVCPAGMN